MIPNLLTKRVRLVGGPYDGQVITVFRSQKRLVLRKITIKYIYEDIGSNVFAYRNFQVK